MKYRFFLHLSGGKGDRAAEYLYRWHIARRSGARMQAGLTTDCWKRDVDDYVKAAVDLVDCMKARGFIKQEAIPLDPAGQMLGGAHRVACALALGLKKVWVRRCDQNVWAPAWGREWFEKNSAPEKTIKELEAIMENLKG